MKQSIIVRSVFRWSESRTRSRSIAVIILHASFSPRLMIVSRDRGDISSTTYTDIINDSTRWKNQTYLERTQKTRQPVTISFNLVFQLLQYFSMLCHTFPGSIQMFLSQQFHCVHEIWHLIHLLPFVSSATNWCECQVATKIRRWSTSGARRWRLWYRWSHTINAKKAASDRCNSSSARCIRKRAFAAIAVWNSGDITTKSLSWCTKKEVGCAQCFRWTRPSRTDECNFVLVDITPACILWCVFWFVHANIRCNGKVEPSRT